MSKDLQINIRVTEEERKQIEKDAQEEQRNISNLLLWCWKEWRKSKRKK